MEREWIPCGQHFPRLELEGEIKREAGASDGQLVKLTGLHIATRVEILGTIYEKDCCEVAIRPFELPVPLKVGQGGLERSPEEENWSVEGPESALERFLDLIDVRGWRLELVTEADGWSMFTLSMAANWQIDSMPEMLPGTSVGETRLTGTFHPDLHPQTHAEKCAISVAWPFSLQGNLALQNPHWSGTRWRANLDLSTLEGLLDGVGEALRDFPLAKIGMNELVDSLPEDSPIEDWLYLDASTNDEGFPTFAIELSTPESFPLAEFGGMKLLLIGRVAFVFEAAFTDEYMNLNFYITFASESSEGDEEFIGFRLEGPIIQKIEEFASTVRSAVALLPGDGIPKLPEIVFEYQLPPSLTPDDISLGDIGIPLDWQKSIRSNPTMDFLADIPLAIPDSALASLTGFQLGNIQGDSPNMMMKILKAENIERGSERGLALTIDLQFKIFGKLLDLDCYWEMILDTSSFAFDPARHVSITVQTAQMRFGDLIIDGLDTLEADWGNGGLSLKASELRAFYVGLAEPGDTSSGFELLVENLVLDSGGLSMQASLVGGASKIDGIGETFTGAAGRVEIVASEVVSAEFMVQGALPVLDNATGKMQLIFGRGFKLLEANAEFQLGIHKKTDWWIEFGLDQLKLKVDTSTPKTKIVIMITGMIAVKPPEGSGDSILGWFKGIELSFTDLVLTSAFDRIPPGLNLVIELNEPKKIDFLGVFQFELRSLGLGSGFDPGQVALSFGGQIFFSSDDKENPDPELHVFKIGQPSPGKWLPRIRLNRLPLNMNISQSVSIKGFVEFIDEPGYKGFKGMALLQIEGKIGIQVLVEISKVRRESDQKNLRVWMVYIEVQDVNIPLVFGFYLRDVGVGFGWRKTLQIMDRPQELLEDPTKTGLSIGPHRPESWINDLEGEEARWTAVLSSWITLGLPKRNEPAPIVGDFIFALRSDLTIVALMRGWVFDTIDQLKAKGGNPPMKGLIYYSARNEHFIAAYIVNPALAAPKGIPPALVQSLLGPPFNFNLETRGGYLRFDLGWPRQLRFPLTPWTGWAGVFFRKQPGSLSIGFGFEIGLFKQYNYGLSFGIGSLSIDIYIRIGIYGMIGIRIGRLAAMYGVVGIHAIVRISLSLRISFKIGWIKIRFSIGYSLELIIAARLEFGITERGFGVAGHASASLRIWKFSFSGSISFVINGDKLAEARRRLNDGGSYFGANPIEIPGDRRIPLLPELASKVPDLPPEVDPLEKKWRTFYISSPDKTRLYVMVLPDDHSYFPTPDPKPEEDASDTEIYAAQADADIEIQFSAANLKLADQPQQEEYVIHKSIDWNMEVTPDQETQEGEEPASAFKIGDLFYESPKLREERALMYYNIAKNQPELLTDPRVRQVAGVEESDTEDFGFRPDVRSPKFSATNSLYDTALETAAKNEAYEALSWEQIALAFSGWEKEAAVREAVRDALPEAFDYEVMPEDSIAQDYWRKQILDSADVLMAGQTGLISRLLREFRQWSESNGSLEDFELLYASGLASSWEIIDSALDFSLTVDEIKVYVGEEKTDVISNRENQIAPSLITQEDEGLGFARKDWDYKVRDILEFQDRESIHFSWEFEARDDDSQLYLMDHHLASGVGVEDELADFEAFEFFDYFRVQRLNLSRNEDPNSSWQTWEVKPAYFPALQDMGSGEKRFFLLAPRFSFSDQFSAENENEQEVQVGDELLYSVSAIDVFGNTSQVTEIVLTRKNLKPPHAPASAELKYSVQMSNQVAEWEEAAQLAIELSDEASSWQGKLIYKLYARQRPLEVGGYFGRGAGIVPLGEGQEGIPSEPTGLLELWEGENLEGVLRTDWRELLNYGTGYELFVQSVSEEGNRSAMIRTLVDVQLTGLGELNQQFTLAYLERVPHPESFAQRWLGRSHIRGEVTTAEFPAYSRDDLNPVQHLDEPDPRFRTVHVRFAHKPFLDSSNHHPAGGYRLEVRDRDATLSEEDESYRALAEIEVVSKEEFLASPSNTKETTSWRSNFLPPGTLSAAETLKLQQNEEEELALEERTWPAVIADWGPASMLVPSNPEEELIPDDQWWHPALFELISELSAKASEKGYEWEYTGGTVSTSTLQELSTDQLQTYLSKEEDPDGSRLLKLAGRSIEGTFKRGATALSYNEVKQLIDEVISDEKSVVDWSQYSTTLEVLLQGDKTSQLYAVRISIPPPLVWKEHLTLEALNGTIQSETSAFISLINSLVNLVGTPALPGIATALEMLAEWLEKLKCSYPLTLPNDRIHTGVTHFLDQGQYRRTTGLDGTILIGLPYAENFARRYVYRLKQYSRYYFAYKELGVHLEVPDYEESIQGQPVRLPRVKPPEPPSVIYKGNHWREEVLCSEWLLPVHEEEPRVQANETMRNRLGFRSLAWTLYCDVKKGLMEDSGWEGTQNWWNRSPDQLQDGQAGLSEAEKELLRSDASSPQVSSDSRAPSLAGHPFTDMLAPKGLVVRIPQLPFYYRYQLAAFARADDLDSPVTLNDPAEVFPSVMAKVAPESAGWELETVQDEPWITFKWQVPAVWDSLSAEEQTLWYREQPLASRLWDYDLRFRIHTHRNTLRKGLVEVKALPWSLEKATGEPRTYEVTSLGQELFWDTAGSFEKREEKLFDSVFKPQIILRMRVTKEFHRVLLAEKNFPFKLECFRTYGTDRQTWVTMLPPKKPVSL